MIQAWTGAIIEFLEANSFTWDMVRGVGVAVPGPRRSYSVLESSPNLPKSFQPSSITRISPGEPGRLMIE